MVTTGNMVTSPRDRSENRPKTIIGHTFNHPQPHILRSKQVMVTQRNNGKSRRKMHQNQKSTTTAHNSPQTQKKPAKTRKYRNRTQK
jgi:hypothetical protein